MHRLTHRLVDENTEYILFQGRHFFAILLLSFVLKMLTSAFYPISNHVQIMCHEVSRANKQQLPQGQPLSSSLSLYIRIFIPRAEVRMERRRRGKNLVRKI